MNRHEAADRAVADSLARGRAARDTAIAILQAAVDAPERRWSAHEIAVAEVDPPEPAEPDVVALERRAEQRVAEVFQ